MLQGISILVGMRKRLPHPLTVVAIGAVMLAGVTVWLATHPPRDYVFIPDKAHPLEPAVRVAGPGTHAAAAGGGIYWVDVFERRATWIDRLRPPQGATFIDPSRILAPGASAAELRDQDTLQMEHSKRVAELVALRAAGYKVKTRPQGSFVIDVYPGAPAAGVIQPSDLVVAVDGIRTPTPDRLRTVVRRKPPGARHVFTLKRGLRGTVRRVPISTVPNPRTGFPIVGIEVENEVTLTPPRNVRISIDIGNVGGPSAGLAFTLQLLQELGHDVTHGLRVAATGTIRADGSVGAVGAIKQKTIGARSAHIDAFLVPVDGDNAKDARRYAGGMRIIPVTTFQQALRALATEARKQ